MTTKTSNTAVAEETSKVLAALGGRVGSASVQTAMTAAGVEATTDVAAARLTTVVEEMFGDKKSAEQKKHLANVARAWEAISSDQNALAHAIEITGSTEEELRALVKSAKTLSKKAREELDTPDDEGYICSQNGATMGLPLCLEPNIVQILEDLERAVGGPAVTIYRDQSTGGHKISFSRVLLEKFGWHDDRRDCGTYNEALSRFGEDLTKHAVEKFLSFAYALKGVRWKADDVIGHLKVIGSKAPVRTPITALAEDIGKTWDGKPRLDEAYLNIFNRTADGEKGQHDEASLSMKGRYSFLAQAARMLHPGIDLTSVDLVIDNQRGGFGKSLFVKARAFQATPKASDNSFDSLSDLGKLVSEAGMFGKGALPVAGAERNRGMQARLDGKLVYENAEGEGLTEAHVTEDAVKTALIEGSPEFTHKHEKANCALKRTDALFITSNSTNILSKVKAGRRRFMITDLELSPAFPDGEGGSLRMNLPWLLENAEQVLAEAICRVQDGESYSPSNNEQDMLREEASQFVADGGVLDDYLPQIISQVSDAKFHKSRKKLVQVSRSTILKTLWKSDLPQHERYKLDGHLWLNEYMGSHGWKFVSKITSRKLSRTAGYQIDWDKYDAMMELKGDGSSIYGFDAVDPPASEGTSQADDFLADEPEDDFLDL